MDFNITNISVAVLEIIVSCFLAYITAKKEVDRRLLQYSFEDRKAAFGAFSELQRTVRIFCSCPIGTYRKSALGAVGDFLVFTDDVTRPLCESLITALNADDARTSEEITARLTEYWVEHKPEITLTNVSKRTKRQHRRELKDKPTK